MKLVDTLKLKARTLKVSNARRLAVSSQVGRTLFSTLNYKNPSLAKNCLVAEWNSPPQALGDRKT